MAKIKVYTAENKELTDIAVKAKESGMTYGQYVAKQAMNKAKEEKKSLYGEVKDILSSNLDTEETLKRLKELEERTSLS